MLLLCTTDSPTAVQHLLVFRLLRVNALALHNRLSYSCTASTGVLFYFTGNIETKFDDAQFRSMNVALR